MTTPPIKDGKIAKDVEPYQGPVLLPKGKPVIPESETGGETQPVEEGD